MLLQFGGWLDAGLPKVLHWHIMEHQVLCKGTGGSALQLCLSFIAQESLCWLDAVLDRRSHALEGVQHRLSTAFLHVHEHVRASAAFIVVLRCFLMRHWPRVLVINQAPLKCSRHLLAMFTAAASPPGEFITEQRTRNEGV